MKPRDPSVRLTDAELVDFARHGTSTMRAMAFELLAIRYQEPVVANARLVQLARGGSPAEQSAAAELLCRRRVPVPEPVEAVPPAPSLANIRRIVPKGADVCVDATAFGDYTADAPRGFSWDGDLHCFVAHFDENDERAEARRDLFDRITTALANGGPEKCKPGCECGWDTPAGT